MNERNPARDLDHALDGHVASSGDVALPVDVATRLRAELAEVQLSPDARRRHLAELMKLAVVGDQPPPAPTLGRTRRRIAVAALAAVLVLAAALFLSARSVPGQRLHPVKLAVEDVRLAAVGFSPRLEARERLRLFRVRTSEAVRLNDARDQRHLPASVVAACDAMFAASAAVDAVHGRDAASLRSQLHLTWTSQVAELKVVAATLPAATPPADRKAIAEALTMMVEHPPPVS
jgi:hypothetical protein